MKKFIGIIFVVVCVFLVMTGCGKTKTLHCDNCNKEVEVKEKSNMTEDWIIYCETCNEELFGDDPILGNNQDK